MVVLLILTHSCKKFVGIPPSPQLIQTAAVFANNQTAISAVDGVYTAIRAGQPSFENGALSIYNGLTSDELMNNTPNPTYDPFYQNAIPSNNSTIAGTFWLTPFNTLYRANAILAGVTESKTLTDSIKRQLTGEMKVIRALTYFYFTNLYGDVPLLLTPDYKQNAVAARTPSTQIYAQIIADLKDAENLLTDNYPSTGKARPNKETAAALLARVYLYEKDWPDAELQASQVINSGMYSLSTDLNSVFTINSTETIWEIASPGEAKSTAEAAAFIPGSASIKPSFSVTASLLNAFESGDLRKSNWINSTVVSNVTYYYPFKYQNRSNTNITEYEVVIRLAELYLIRAEARAMQANIAAATIDINTIRSRAGLPSLSNLTLAQSITAIMQERRIELFAEWGNRWFDLKRTGNIDEVLGAVKSDWQSFDALFPIPYSQILYNINLKQNPGYN